MKFTINNFNIIISISIFFTEFKKYLSFYPYSLVKTERIGKTKRNLESEKECVDHFEKNYFNRG